MATSPTTQTPRADTGAARPGPLQRAATETKQAFKTTGFYVFLAAVIGGRRDDDRNGR